MPKPNIALARLSLVVALLPLLLFAQDVEQKYLNVTPIEGIENPVVTCVFQDSYGFIWFGSLNGLYRWDGIKAKHFYHNSEDTSSMPANQIISMLFEDEETNLWFGTLGKGALKYQRKTNTFKLYPFNEKHPKIIDAGWITRTNRDLEGNIWGIGITNRLFKYSFKTNNIEIIIPDTIDESNPTNNILSLCIDYSREFFWVGTQNGLYKYLIQEKKFIRVAAHNSGVFELERQSIVQILADGDSLLWLATQDALLKYRINSNKISLFMKPDFSLKNYLDEQIEEIIDSPVNGQNSIWVFTKSDIWQVNKLTGKITLYLFKEEGKQFHSSEFISAEKGRFIDKNGFLWLATDNLGAAFVNLNKNPFNHFVVKDDTKEELKKTGATSFFVDSQKNLLVGTGTHGLYFLDKNMEIFNWLKFSPQDPFSLSNNFIYSLLETKDGNIWVGTENGLNRIDKGTKEIQLYLNQPLDYEGGLPYVRISQLFQDSTGRLWVGTSQGLYFSDNCESKSVSFTAFEGIPPYFSLIQKIFSDDEGNLWFTTPVHMGIFKLENKAGYEQKIFNYNSNSDNNENFITDGALCMLEDYENNFWLGTKDGLFEWNIRNNNFNHFYKGRGLDANMIYWMEDDNRGNLWLSTEIGLVRFNPSLPLERMSKTFTYKDGLPFEETYPYNFYKSPDGVFFIGGRRGSGNGFFRFNPDSIMPNKHIPPIVITDFNVKGETFQLDSNIVVTKQFNLKHDEDFFSFEFAALDYTDPEKNQYAYFLEGFESDWNYSGNRNYANYTGVPPGKYTFRVKGSNNDGYWNETGVSVAITIMPPRWRTWWAYILYGLSFLIILFSLFYIYLHRQQLLHDLERLEKEKELMSARSLIEGQEEERKRIAEELHDGLGVLLSAAKIQVSSINLVSEKEKPLVEKASRLLERASKDVRKISHNMMPGLLKNFGLFEALRDLVENVNDTKKIASSINIIGIERRLPDNKEIMLYRIIQELINNTLKHAGAKTIRLEVLMQPNQLEITYADDGMGFDISTSQSLKSIGLQSIRSRLDFLGGKLTFESEKDKGAIFYMKIPL